MFGKLLSVVIPVKDDNEIFKLLGQIKHQENALTETIIITNGSSNAFNEKLKNILSDHQYVSFFSMPKGDIAAARNTGIKAAQGLNILFLDSDCILPADYFRNIIDYLGSQDDEIIRIASEIFSSDTVN